MFTKKLHADVKKSTQKIQDVKKDSATRLKHLRIILENVESEEAKNFFESNFSHIYLILYDSFVLAEGNLRQRVHKSHREELDCVLHVLEKVLVLLPELLSRRWQCHSLSRILCKLLHPGNVWRIRREAIRYFLMWYQILGDNAPECLHAIFATLVPGFPSPVPGLGLAALSQSSASIFHDSTHGQVSMVEIQPLLPPQGGENHHDDHMRFFFDALLEFMVSQVIKIEWRDRALKQHKCFTFLFERFKQYYLPHIFPQFSHTTSLYSPILDLPSLRKLPTEASDSPEGKRHLDPFGFCRVAVIKWVAVFTHVTNNRDMQLHINTHSNNSATSTEDPDSYSTSELRRVSMSQPVSNRLELASSSLDSYHAMLSQPDSYHSLSEECNSSAFYLVQEVLYSSRENVNFVHEIYRQAFLLNFNHSSAIRKTITVYKDWIQMNVPELPPFVLEPLESHRDERSGPPSYEHSSMESSDGFESSRMSRLRNDSYLGAIHRENLLVRAGLQNLLQVFVTHASNVFMLEVSPNYPPLLEEQVDSCKRVLNIYRYMVMHTRMEEATWEQLLLVLLQITSLILSKTPPKWKEENLGGKLAPAIFQTLIVTWIKANLNVVISSELWDQFLAVLSSLTQWEELIREWAKTLDTLTRVLARHVYNLDLTDLPLDRLSEQKAKKHRAGFGKSLAGGDQLHGNYGTGRRRSGAVTSGRELHLQGSQPEQDTSSFTPTEINLDSLRLTTNLHKRNDTCNGLQSLSRSWSEGNLANRRLVKLQRRHAMQAQPHNNTINIPVLPVSLEKDLARILSNQDSPDARYKVRRTKKSRSMDSLQWAREGTSIPYSESEGPTRSPSPALSSGVESSSIKDTPMQIDVLSGDGTSLDEADGGRAVMAGGHVRGWLPDVAVILWRRMLGALGDINHIKDPALHLRVFEYLLELNDTFVKIRMNQSVSADNQITPPPPEFIPPLTLVAPWCFKALLLPDSYHQGKLCAYRLLCQMTVTPHDILPSNLHLALFYKVLHQGLKSSDQSIVNTLVQYCGSRFFSLMLPGYTLLLNDFIHAADTIVSSREIKKTPRTEAASILGALLSQTHTLSKLPVLQPNTEEFSTMPFSGLKDHVLNVLLKCGKNEPAGLARCIALSSLGIYLYQELTHETFHSKIREALNVLLLALRFTNRTVGLVASDILLLLCDHANTLLKHFPEVPQQIIEVIALTLSQLMPPSDVPTSEEDKHLLTSLMFCMGEWCMQVPPSCLVVPHNGSCLLFSVFQVLNQLQVGTDAAAKSNDAIFRAELLREFDSKILLDNSRQRSSESLQGQRLSPRSPQSCRLAVQLAANMVSMHLVNHLGHFPMGIGAARLSSMVVEQDDVPGLAIDELSSEVFSAPNIQLFVVSNSLLVSMVELPTLDVPGGGVTAGLTTASSQVRVILRDLGGKASWDASILYCSPENRDDIENPTPLTMEPHLDESQMISSLIGWSSQSCPPQHTLRHRPADVLPQYENAAQDMDNLDDLLQYIGHTSPECLENLDTPLNIPSAPPNPLTRQLEEDTITVVLNQRNSEHEYLQSHTSDPMLMAEKCSPIKHQPSQSSFQYCRLLFSQLGLAGWEHRKKLFLLAKNEKLLRELRNLDTQRCRETHKVAVVYVAEGQEDKNSILSNTCGSHAYEQFIAGLAWEVELESHTGFLGGLQRNKSTGDTAPYYATSFIEVIFHVATRMPSDSQESLLQKTRHLGNDEVHIVWSEHSRDYRRGVIPTEFCDILIVIYPLPNKLFRIQVSRKPDVPYFGPLFNEVIVDEKVLPGLVRASAISASRAKRSMLPFYQNYYEERSKSLETVVRNHKEVSTFEEFTAQVYSPVQKTSPSPNNSSAASMGSYGLEHTGPPSTGSLAEALLDAHHPHLHSTAGPDGMRVWYESSESASVDGSHGIHVTPRPLKKLSFKSTARKSFSSRSESLSLTPPDSPTSRKSK